MYALLFADSGLSAAQISTLFILWSVTSVVFEVPSGLWADTVSRRRLLTAAPLLTGVGYALWTFAPSYPSFALGFVLWGMGGALRSGTLQALVYEELTRAGASGSYARLIGRSKAVGAVAVLAATALASPVLMAGGYQALGVVSIAATLIGALVAWSLPESRDRSEPREAASFVEALRGGLAEVRRTPEIRGSLLLLAMLVGITGALDEYLPLLALETGVGAPTVPLLILLVYAGSVAGGWSAGRGVRWTAPALALAAGSLAAGAGIGHPAGIVLVAVAFGTFEWATAAAEARLQDRVADRSRATITSMSGLGSEVVAVLTFAGYALGSVWAGPGPLFALAAVPYLIMALVLGRTR